MEQYTINFRIGDIVTVNGKSGSFVVLKHPKPNKYTVAPVSGPGAFQLTHTQAADRTEEEAEHMVKRGRLQNNVTEQKGDMLPDWAYNGLVGEIAAQVGIDEDSKELSLREVAGSVIPNAVIIMFALWAFYPCFLILAMNTAICQASNFSEYPLHIWFMFFPIALVCYALEFLAFRTAIVPQYQVLKAEIFEVLGYPIGFCGWFVKATLQSWLGFFSFATTSAFAGTVWATMSSECEAIDPSFVGGLEDRWEVMLKHALYGFFQRVGIPSFRWVVIFAWSCQLIKLVTALCQTVPIRPFLNAQSTIRYDYNLCSNHHKSPGYYTMWHSQTKQNHGASLMALGYANGLNLLVDGDLKYARKRTVIEWLNILGPHAQPPPDLNWDLVNERVIPHIESQLHQCRGSMLEGCLGSGLLLNLKMTMWALVGTVIKKQMFFQPQGWLQFSYILVALLSCLLQLLYAIEKIRYLLRWIGRFAAPVRLDVHVQATTRLGCIQMNSLTLKLVEVCFLSIDFFLEVVYAIAKFSYGALFCPVDRQMVDFFSDYSQWCV